MSAPAAPTPPTAVALPLARPEVLQRRDGVRRPCEWRVLAADDVDTVFALHREVAAALPAGVVANETRAFFAAHAQAAGRLYGVFDPAGLVAYAVLGLPGEGDDNFGLDHGLHGAALPGVAHLDGAAVAPTYRGNRLQSFLTQWRLADMMCVGRHIALSTVSPANPWSLASLLENGLTARALRIRFGGWRYLLRRDLVGTDAAVSLAAPDATGRWLPLGDVAAQQALFEQGWWAWRMRGQAGVSAEIYLAPPVPAASAAVSPCS